MAISPRFSSSVPGSDNRSRRVCDHCGFVAYENPRVVVGSVVRHGETVLLCRRAIDPRRGFWTIPAGYMELGETPDAGARREAHEEACAAIETGELLAVYTIARLSQVQIFYRASLVDPAIAAGEESLEVGLFGWDEIPWDELAFPSVAWALAHEREVHLGNAQAPFANPPGETGSMSE
ncbi:MAG: NUDIX hydrolase [Rhodobiaceae bacterium]|nr:NUDIX hydrolase [Rhodobiaceae bacterium]